MTKRKGDRLGMVYRHGDPKDYGYICPHCSKRYGARHPLGVVEVTRCATCPSLAVIEQMTGMKKQAKKLEKFKNRLGEARQA